MKKISLIRNNPCRWHHLIEGDNEVWVKGKVFYNDSLLEGKDFAGLFLRLISEHQEGSISGALNKINGNYSVVINSNNKVVAAVDRSRSYPLFYGIKDNDLYLSDDAHWVKEQYGDISYDPISAEEFLLTGYVTGQDTLYSKIKQLQAGEYLIANIDKSHTDISLANYHSYLCENTMEYSEEKLLQEFNNILIKVFTRLIRWLDGRTAVVPLSGGYDSRLIVLMLKKLGYENIITFTFGRSGNKDSAISEDAAKRLGVPWVFIEYDNELWYEWFHSQEKEDYYRFADGLCSLPVYTLLPAVKELKNRNAIPIDSVIVQGHTIALFGNMVAINLADKNKLIDKILKKHYSLWPLASCPENIRSDIRKKVSNQIDSYILTSPDWSFNAFESWFIREREAKFIVNSVRVHEFYGYEWYLPFWDNEFMDFWYKVPASLRIGKKLLTLHTDLLYENTTGLRPVYMSSREHPMSFRNIRGLYECLRRKIDCKYAYDNHPWASYGIMTKKQFNKLYTGREEKFAFHALEYLGRIKYE